VTNAMLNGESVQINTETHGKVDGKTAVDDAQLAESQFLEQDLEIQKSFTSHLEDNVCVQFVCSELPVTYFKNANQVINAWCYSDRTADLMFRNSRRNPLVMHYVEHCGKLPLPISEGFSFSVDSLFTNLIIVSNQGHIEKELGLILRGLSSLSKGCEHFQSNDESIELEEFFAIEDKVLVLGETGVGKSTLCQKIAHS
jgi:hypothetical protein